MLQRRGTRTGLITAAALALLSATAAAADVRVRVKGGSLSVTGDKQVEDSHLTLTPTAQGLTLTPRDGTTINGSADPFEAVGVTRDWNFKLGRQGKLDLVVEPPGVGVDLPRPRKVNISAGGIDLDMREVAVQSNVKIGVGNALTTGNAPRIVIEDCTIGGSLKSKVGRDGVTVRIRDTQIGGKLSVTIKERFLSFDRSSVELTDSRCGQLALSHRSHRTSIDLDDLTVEGNGSIKGLVDIDSEDCGFGGNLAVKATNFDETIAFAGALVGGTLKIDSGGGGDDVAVDGGSVGRLDVRTKSGNDVLRTLGGVTVGPRSRFDGSTGNDTWVTFDDTLLDLKNVETVNAN